MRDDFFAIIKTYRIRKLIREIQQITKERAALALEAGKKTKQREILEDVTNNNHHGSLPKLTEIPK